jgi:hypothetical protein
VPVPGKKTFPVWNKQIEIEIAFSLSISVTASIDDQGAVQKAAIKKALDWHVANEAPVLDGGTIFSNLKLDVSKTQIAVTSHTSTGIGNFSLTLTLVGLSKGISLEGLKLGLKVATLNIVWSPVTINLQPETVEGISLTDIQIEPGGQITIAPNYQQIVLNWAKKEAEEQLAKEGGEKAGEVVVTTISFDVIMATALGAVAVGTVFGVVDMFVKKAKLDNIKATLYPALTSLNQGVQDGLANQKVSGGSGDMYDQGWNLGQQAWKQAADQMSQQGDLPPPDEMQAELHDAAVKAMSHWSAWHDIVQHMQDTFFDRWVAENHGYTTFEGDVRDAISAIYGIPHEPEDGPHMQKWAAVSKLPKVMTGKKDQQ